MPLKAAESRHRSIVLLKKEAKKVYSLARKEQRQTGGGPEIKLVTPAINRTIDLCRDSAAFNGIGGFQTSVNGNLCSLEDGNIL
jgi:hypothetical protein